MKDEIDDGDYDPRDEFPKSIYDDVYFEDYRREFSELEVSELLRFPLQIDQTYHSILLMNQTTSAMIRYEDTSVKIKMDNKIKVCNILNGARQELGVKNIVFIPDMRTNSIRVNGIALFMLIDEPGIKNICGSKIKEEEAYYVKETLYYLLARRLNGSVTR